MVGDCQIIWYSSPPRTRYLVDTSPPGRVSVFPCLVPRNWKGEQGGYSVYLPDPFSRRGTLPDSVAIPNPTPHSRPSEDRKSFEIVLRLRSPCTGVSAPPSPEIPKKSQKGVPGPPARSVKKVPKKPQTTRKRVKKTTKSALGDFIDTF